MRSSVGSSTTNVAAAHQVMRKSATTSTDDNNKIITHFLLVSPKLLSWADDMVPSVNQEQSSNRTMIDNDAEQITTNFLLQKNFLVY